MRKTRAFTLIELLVVMAITAVLLTLIVVPIIQSFALTRSAQAFGDAQDKGRLLTDRIAREVGNAVSVRDAASTAAIVPNGPGLTGTQTILLPYTKLDLIPPAQGTPATDGSGNPIFIDPITGKVDPTLTRPKGDINLNGVPGATIVRWFVGLNRPFKSDGSVASYNEPYTGLLMARNGDQDNLFVLRRIEVQPFLYRNDKNTPTDNTTKAWRPNLTFFRSNDASDGTDDTRIIDLDDPYFFVPDGMYLPEGATNPGGRRPDPNKNARVAAWASKSTIQTEISRYDMVRPLVQGSPPQVVRDGMNRITVVPLVQFRPTRVANEPAAGSAAARPGEAVDGLELIGPDTYRTDRGLWTDAIVRYYPSGYDPTQASALMEVASVSATGDSVITQGAADASGLDTPTGGVLFNLRGYERALAAGAAYPFTASVNTANVETATGRAVFTPFRAITATGKIVTSFPIDQVGTTAVTGPNLPYVVTNNTLSPDAAGGKLGPAQDPNLSTAPYSPYGVGTRTDYDVNRAYNRAYNAYPDLQGTMQRFIDLRFVPNADGTPSPLCPLTNAGLTGFTVKNAASGGTVNRVRIVPGSDEVFGPDQTASAYNSGTIVRYTRTTSLNPGPNQYRLVYADIPEPTNSTGKIDYSASLLSQGASTGGVSASDLAAFDPDTANYSATNVVSAVFQPRFKAGYLQLGSEPNVPLPAGRITVSYRFQFNGPTDTFAVDLDTREIMQILLTIKNYPQSTAPNAQSVTLKSTATLRNALR